MVVIRLYQQALASNPVLTQCVATGALFGLGDVLAQQGVEKKGWSKHDWSRTARLSAFGLVLAGPSLTLWYRFLDRRVRLANPIANLLTRVALDQFAFSPVSMATFFAVNGVMEGLDMGEIREKLRNSYWTGLVSNWKVWPGIQLLNFYFVPVNHRTLVVNTVALGWNTYLSDLNNKATLQARANEQKQQHVVKTV
ncbi:Protein required for ethanol metabolism [Sorochytrium milnesiophthora]